MSLFLLPEYPLTRSRPADPPARASHSLPESDRPDHATDIPKISTSTDAARTWLVADALNRTENIDCAERRPKVEILYLRTRLRIVEKGKPLRSLTMRRMQIAKRLAQLGDILRRETAQISKSRVTIADPCRIPAKPPTITKSILASQSRWIS